MSIRYSEDLYLKKVGNPVRYQVREQPPLVVYSTWRRPAGHFWAAQPSLEFLQRLHRAWSNEVYFGFRTSAEQEIGFVPKIFLGDISKKGGGTWKDHKSHAEGTQIDIYYITHDGRNVRLRPKHSGQADEAWNFHTEMNRRLLRAILSCRPFRVLTQVTSILQHPEFANNPRIENKPPHWDHFHVDVVRQKYQQSLPLADPKSA